MYSQLKKRIEEEKQEFQRSLKNIQQIKNSQPTYLVYEESKQQASPNRLSPIIQKEDNLLSNSKLQNKLDDQILSKLRQITDLKREEKVAKISTQLQHFRRQNRKLAEETIQLKQLVSEKDKQMNAVEQNYKQNLHLYAEQLSQCQNEATNLRVKIKEMKSNLAQKESTISNFQIEEVNLRAIIKQLRFNLQEKELLIAQFQMEKYQLIHKNQENNILILQKIRDGQELIEKNKRYQSVFEQLTQKLINFSEKKGVDSYQIQQMKLNGISKQYQESQLNKQKESVYLKQLICKIQVILCNQVQSIRQINTLTEQNQRLLIKQQGFQQKVRQYENHILSIQHELKAKNEEMQTLQNRIMEVVQQNEILNHKLFNCNQQLSQKASLFQLRENSLTERIQILTQRLSLSEGELTISLRNQKQKQQKIMQYRQELQKMKNQTEYSLSLSENRQMQFSIQTNNLKQQINSLLKQQQISLIHLRDVEQKNKDLQLQIEGLNLKIGQEQKELLIQRHKLQIQQLKQIQLQRQKVKIYQLQGKVTELQQLNSVLQQNLSQYQRIKCQLTKQNDILQEQSVALKLQNSNMVRNLQNDKILYADLQNKYEIQQNDLQRLIVKNQELNVLIKNTMLKDMANSREIQDKDTNIVQINLQNTFQNAKDHKLQGQLQDNHLQGHHSKQNEQFKFKGYALLPCQSVQDKANLHGQNEESVNKQQFISKLAYYQEAIIHLANKFSTLYPFQQIITLKPLEIINEVIAKLINFQNTKQQREQLIQKNQLLQEKHDIFKTSYLKLQSSYMLALLNVRSLQDQLSQKDIQMSRIIKQNNLYLQQQNQLNQRISSLNEGLKNIQDGNFVDKKQSNSQLQKYFWDIISKINSNCLKNNCDSVGIITIELNKSSNDVNKNMQLTLSPTDLQRFNRKQDIRNIQELKLQYDGKDQAKCQQVSPFSSVSSLKEHLPRLGQRKKSEEITKFRFAAIRENKVKFIDSKVKSQKYIQQRQQATTKKHLKGQQQAYSTQNHAQVPQITLPYPLLLQRYRNLKTDLQKMQQYICHVHSVNFKIKKSIAEVDHYAKFNAIDKISQKLTSLVKHNQHFLKNQSQQFTAQMGKILSQLQSYIHFVDHLSKIQPFAQSNKYNNRFIRLKRKVTTLAKFQRQCYKKRTYSEGESRQDDLIEHFDANLNEPQEDFPQIDTELKEADKKEEQEIKRYFQENKELQSQISSVRNQSLRSQNSFINSKSQLWQLGAYLKNKLVEDTQQHDHDLNRKQANDSDRLSQMSIRDIKSKYAALKNKNRSLTKEKNHLQKHCKKLQHQQNDYKKRIAKMTKQFNQSFKLLCHHINSNKQNSKNNLISNHQSVQVQTTKLESAAKIIRSNSKDKPSLDINDSDQLNNSQNRQVQNKINQKQVKIRQLQSSNDKLKVTIRELEKKCDYKNNIASMALISIRSFEVRLKRIQDNFRQFINKIMIKAPLASISSQNSAPLLVQKQKSFRKNSNSFKEVEVAIILPQQEDTKVQQILQLIKNKFSLQVDPDIALGVGTDQLGKMLQDSVDKIKKTLCHTILTKVNEHLKKLIALHSDDDCFTQLDKIYLQFDQYFEQKDLITQFFSIIKQLVVNFKRQSEIQIDNLSVNSHCEDLKKRSFQQKVVLEGRVDEEQKSRIVYDIQKQYEKVKKQSIQLAQQLKEITFKASQKDQFITIQQEQLALYKQTRAKQIQSLTTENVALREQLVRLKQKPPKKSRVYHIVQ